MQGTPLVTPLVYPYLYLLSTGRDNPEIARTHPRSRNIRGSRNRVSIALDDGYAQGRKACRSDYSDQCPYWVDSRPALPKPEGPQ